MQKLILAISKAVMFLFTAFCIEAQTHLPIPPLLNGPEFNLIVQQGITEFYTGSQTPTFGVNGNILAPTLVFEKGQEVQLNVKNNLNTSTTMHWHGFHLPAQMDGGPHQMIDKGMTWKPKFTVLNNAGTYWYHPHGDGKTDLHVSKGVSGFIIVRDSVEGRLELPRTYGVDDFPIVVQTKCFDILNQIVIATSLDTAVMANATVNPTLKVPAQVVRLRLLNGASDRSFYFGFSNNMDFHQIATDGGLLEEPVTLKRLRLSPGERAEILINLQTMQGQVVKLMSYSSELANGIIGSKSVGMGMAEIHDYDKNPLNGKDFSIMNLEVVASTSAPVLSVPQTLVSIDRLNPSSVTTTRRLTFSPEDMSMSKMAEGPFHINGTRFSMDTINIFVKKNAIEKWILDNRTLVAHPFHIHDVQFDVVEFNGVTIPDNQKGKKDVVLVMPNQTVSLLLQFKDYTDSIPYMYHCHLLHHEDDGMMGSFAVVDSTSSDVEVEHHSQIAIYPQPANESIVVKLNNMVGNSHYQLIIHNLLGDKLYSTSTIIDESAGTIRVNTQQLPNGMYYMLVKGEANRFYKSFVISR